MQTGQIEAIFAQLDKNADGEISKEELWKCVQENNMSVNESQMNSFFKKIDINGDGVISREEFMHFMEFHNSAFSNFDFMLDMTSNSLGFVKWFQKMMTPDQNNDELSKVQITLKDNGVQNTDGFASSFGVHFGTIEKNHNIAKFVGNPLDIESFVGLKFHVQDKGLIINQFNDYIDALKEILASAGQDVAEIAEVLEFDFYECDDGVFMVIDPSKHAFTNSFLQSLKASLEKLTLLNILFSAEVGSENNMLDKEVTFKQIAESKMFLNVCGNSIQTSQLSQTKSVQQLIEMQKNKNNPGAILASLYMLSFKNAKVELNIDSEERIKLLEQLNLENQDEPVLKGFFEEMKEDLDGDGTLDFLDSLDFIKEAINDLNNSGCSSISVVVKAHDLYAVVNLRSQVYELLKDFIELDN